MTRTISPESCGVNWHEADRSRSLRSASGLAGHPSAPERRFLAPPLALRSGCLPSRLGAFIPSVHTEARLYPEPSGARGACARVGGPSHLTRGIVGAECYAAQARVGQCYGSFIQVVLQSNAVQRTTWLRIQESSGRIILSIPGGDAPKFRQHARTVTRNHGLAGWALTCGVARRLGASLIEITGSNPFDGIRKRRRVANAGAYSAHPWPTYSSHGPNFTSGERRFGLS